jgi:AraC-like DNA-binding protein
MSRTLGPAHRPGLERSGSDDPADLLRDARGGAGLQRAEVHLRDIPFERHRHAEYALGITIRGVQTFGYRGARRTCLPGQLHLLYPDEPHDGAAADQRGLRYRIVYISPEIIRDASPTGRLPFVPAPVQSADGAAAALAAALAGLLRDVDEPIDDLAAAAAAVALTDGLVQVADDAPPPRPATIDLRAVRRAADFLAGDVAAPSSGILEELCGVDRYTLSRHFKAAYGTTPDRYRLQHQLNRARMSIRRGCPLAVAAADAGFADQSHLTRQFKRAYGLTPGQWRTVSSPGRD